MLRISGFSFRVRCFLLLFVPFFCYLLFLLFCYCCYSLKFLLLLCGDVETNPGPRSKCCILYHNIRGLMRNFNDLQIASRTMILFFALRPGSLVDVMYPNCLFPVLISLHFCLRVTVSRDSSRILEIVSWRL